MHTKLEETEIRSNKDDGSTLIPRPTKPEGLLQARHTFIMFALTAAFVAAALIPSTGNAMG